ncbi:MAG: HEAT repeat domain-containing protein [Planctomycetia bacterium]|nr:HEAT repeat domain-containing protein [Planctomycetia bacterium]
MKKYFIVFCLFLMLLPIPVQAQSELFGEKKNEGFVEKIQPDLIKKALDPATSPYDFMLLSKQLGIYGDKNAASAVAQSLGIRERSQSARNALEQMPFPEALAELRKAAGKVDDPLLKAGILNSLGMRRDKDAIPVLLSCMDNKNNIVAASAVFALARMGDPSYKEKMLAKMGNQDPLLAKSYADLNLMYGEFLSREGKKDDAENVWFAVAEKAPSDFHKEAACFQILLRDSANTRSLAAQWLTGNDSLKYRAVLRAAQFVKNDAMCDILINAYEKVSDQKKLALLAGLGDQKNVRAQKILLAGIGSDKEEIRQAALGAMKSFADRSYLKTLIAAALSGDDAVRKSSIGVIELMDDEVNADILKLLKGSDKAKAFGAELVGLRKIKLGLSDLFELAKSGPESVRIPAAKALGEIAEMDQFAWLADQLVKEKDPVLKAAAKEGLKAACGQIPNRSAAVAIIGKTANSLQGQKEDALFVLKLLPLLDCAAAQDLVEKIACGPNRESWDIGTQVLGQWMDPSIAPLLLKLANIQGYPYANRALKGYLRFARQFAMPVWMRRAMVRDALASPACGEKEKEVANIIIKQYKLDMNVPETDEQKLKRNITILQAVYGVPNDLAKQKIITDKVKERFSKTESLRIDFPEGMNKAFGGDPAPNTPKKVELTVKYFDTGKTKTILLPEGNAITIPQK